MKEKCFYVPGSDTIIDVADSYGLSSVYKQKLEQIQEKYPGAVLIDLDAAIEKIHAIEKKRFLVDPEEITEKKYYNMFECLPPCRYSTSNDRQCEGFYMSEFFTGNWTQHLCRIGNRYFSAIRKAGVNSVQSFITECEFLKVIP